MNIKKLSLVALAVLVLGVFFYLLQIWASSPRYSLGVDTPGNFKDAILYLKPQGSFDFGVGGQAFYENPRWPVPQSIRLEFRDDHNKKFAAELVTGLAKKFSGKIVVFVEKKSDGYYLFLQTTDRENHVSRSSAVPVKSND